MFTTSELPLKVGVAYPSRDAARAAPRARLALTFCHSCGLTFNGAHDSSQNGFQPGYNAALHHSEIFRNFIDGVAERLVDRFDLRGKTVLEIGCGDGFFLTALARKGGNECIGIDPTLPSDRTFSPGNGGIRLISDCFGPAHDSLPADFICSLSVIEVIPPLAQFMVDLHRLAKRSDASLYIETFNAWRAFETSEVWSVNCEQCNYFSLRSLRTLFSRHGFDICDADYCYEDGQYVFVEARAGQSARSAPEAHSALAAPTVLLRFGDAFKAKSMLWSDRFEQYRNEDQRVVVWGAGGKGITFLNSVRHSDAVKFVVEINPDKQGKFVAGTGHAIVAPETLSDFRPHKVIITNPLYEAEIRSQASELGVDAEFLIA
ncbi:MAG: class I SAM-dependent methyltransferase [Pseudomonadota bacterium]